MKYLLTLLLLFSTFMIVASPFARPSEPNGILRLNQDHPSENIFPVTVYQINGKQILKRNNAVWLKPGTHTIRVTSAIALNQRSKYASKRQKFNNPVEYNTLEIKVEEGKTYYVGYDTNDRDPNKWRPVVWKVK